MESFDLDAYLARISHDRPVVPTVDTLRSLLLRHTLSIPFENLDPLLGRGVRIDLASIQRKLVQSRRGGYCFEHNLLLQAALRSLGFEANCLGARVYLDQPADAGVPARTHLALRVTFGGSSYLADVGFGGQTPTGPLDLAALGESQKTPHEAYRILPAGNEYDLEAKVAGTWKLLYRFGTTVSPMIDLEVANHYVATYPASLFRNAIMAAMIAPDGRHTLINDRLSFTGPEGRKESQTLRDVKALREALAARFGIDAPADGDFDEAFSRLTVR